MSVLKKLTEGIVERSLMQEGAALMEKWERTGLLEGLSNENTKNGMARLLENQAAQLLKEASTMSGGDVEGFASVAFPIVRRVFGNLIANDLVSVQPMSLPSGLIFFLDFQTTNARLGTTAGTTSLYGGGVVGQQLTGGVDLGESTAANAESGFYNLNNGYTSPTGSTSLAMTVVASGVFGGGLHNEGATAPEGLDEQEYFDALCRYDADFTSGTTDVVVGAIAVGSLDQPNLRNLASWRVTDTQSGSFSHVRRLTQISGAVGADGTRSVSDSHVLLFFASDADRADDWGPIATVNVEYPITDDFGGTAAAKSGEALGAVVGQSVWGLENEENIPEIDIKVDSVSITAVTKKLKAKWTPELGQDLNAYHNLDAEVELTSILSEQIALEIDREILNDLVSHATADTLYWSRRPGTFVNRQTSRMVDSTTAAGPDFTGTVSEWYETLVETINDVSAQIHRKTLRGGANFIVVSPEVANILEFTAGFRASVTADTDKGQVGAVKVGSISKKWDVYVDPYFLRNVVLVGRKGNSFLESGYVYAPYVPLQVTPTIFGTEDFVPRKGVMTRYAKKMVRPDMYGLVVVQDLLG